MWMMLLFYLAIAVGVSFICSVLEAVLLSITPSFVAERKARGDGFGRQLARLKADIDRPLAAILTLNTFAHTFGAAGVGAAAQKIWQGESGETALTIVSVVVTIIILIASEIIPKTLGAVYWRRLAWASIQVTRVLMALLLPFLWVSQFITRLLRPTNRVPQVSRAEIASVAEVGYRDGIIRRSEQAIIANLMRLQDLDVEDIMTPRPSIIAEAADRAIGSLGDVDTSWYVSRIPIYSGGDLDRVQGYVLKDEILAAQLGGRGADNLASLQRPLPVVAPDDPLSELYDQLVARSEHIALVRDRQGRTVGLVTMEDLIEAVLGIAITDEGDDQVALKRRARSHWAVRARRSGVIAVVDEQSGTE